MLTIEKDIHVAENLNYPRFKTERFLKLATGSRFSCPLFPRRREGESRLVACQFEALTWMPAFAGMTNFTSPRLAQKFLEGASDFNHPGEKY